MSSYDQERVFQVACPSCGAKAGERCKTKAGNSRSKHDFHTTRKGIIYPEFATARRGLSDRSRKASQVVDALEKYLDARQRLHTSEGRQGLEFVAGARRVLFEALKDGFTYGQ